MTPEQKIKKVMRSCRIALKHIEEGNERKAIKDMHFAKDYANASIHLLWLTTEEDMKEEEKK